MKLNEPCVYCGRTLKQLILLAAAQDAGAIVSPSPTTCEHVFPEELALAEKRRREEAATDE